MNDMGQSNSTADSYAASNDYGWLFLLEKKNNK